jgi:leader peptidase (prepilin peptidase)/N-methyltransferase
MLVAVLSLWGCLLAASLIDAETGYIPLPLTGLALGVGLAAAVAQGALGPPSLPEGWPPGKLPGALSTAGLGGLVGILVACAALWSGAIPRSFASVDPERELSPGEARREVLLETPFLLLPAICAIAAGWFLRGFILPGWLEALGVAGVGVLAGGGSIWLTRVLGTLGFGREAMGLGDVHLLAAAGAVIGWRDALLAYLIAPFVALGWLAARACLARLGGRPGRELPYGPHLAIAVVVAFLGRPWVVPFAAVAFGLRVPAA